MSHKKPNSKTEICEKSIVIEEKAIENAQTELQKSVMKSISEICLSQKVFPKMLP